MKTKKMKKIILSIGAVLPSVVGMSAISSHTHITINSEKWKNDKKLRNKLKKYITIIKNPNSEVVLGETVDIEKDFKIKVDPGVNKLFAYLNTFPFSISKVDYQGNIKIELGFIYKETWQSPPDFFKSDIILVRGYGKHKITVEDKKQMINNISITKKDNDLTKWAQDKDDYIINYRNIAIKIGKRARQLNVRSAWPIGIIEKNGKKQIKLRIIYREASANTKFRYQYKYFDAIFEFSKTN